MDERKDFTIDPVNFAGLADYVRELQAGGMHFISILVRQTHTLCTSCHVCVIYMRCFVIVPGCPIVVVMVVLPIQ